MRTIARLLAGFMALTLSLPSQQANQDRETDVTRATLPNGLRVVIVRDTLAPVAAVHLNYLAGGSDAPAGFPGTAHAEEHMAFRGCRGLTADQISAIYAQLGGYMDAETQENNTQYYVTVPAKDLDVALRVDAACVAEVENSPEQWAQERGAIEQEVSRDLSNPVYNYITRLNHILFAGTPYEHDPLGTKESFDKTDSALLQRFYQTWYSPSNAILIITGDVQPEETLRKVREYFSSVPARKVPPHAEVKLQPVKAESFTMDSNLPYLLSLLSFRFPGSESPDYAAARVLADVLSSQRGELYQLVVEGKALAAAFSLLETYPKASAASAYAALPAGADPAPGTAELGRVLSEYLSRGVPADLVEASKKGAIASAEFSRNSITNLARVWSQALAAEGRQSPKEDIDAIRRVTVEDVNRVARKYITLDSAIATVLKPTKAGEAAAAKGFGGSEKAVTPPTKPVALPEWAEAAVKSLRVPEPRLHPVDMKLANGIRLIVQEEKTSPTVTLLGSIKTQAEMQTPPGQEGVADVLEGLFSYGTKKLDRVAFQKALDDIAATESAGTNFELKVLKGDFERGVELLADNELNPALPEDAFKVVQKQTAEYVEGEHQSPSYRFDRALTKALLPPTDPLLREVTPKTVSALRYRDVLDQYARAYRPDLTTIAIVGDITPEQARAVIEKYFSGWKAQGEKPNVVLPPVPANKPSAVHVPDPSQVQATVVLAEELEMNRFSPDYYPLQLGNHVLGGGFYATRLYRDLRQNAGLVYNIDDSLTASETRASYSIDFGCDPQNVSKARTMVDGELRAMRSYNVSPSELQQAKALLLRQIPLGESSEDAIASGYLRRARTGLPLDEPQHAAQRYFQINADEIRQAFARHVDPANFVQVVRGPAPQ